MTVVAVPFNAALTLELKENSRSTGQQTVSSSLCSPQPHQTPLVTPLVRAVVAGPT